MFNQQGSASAAIDTYHDVGGDQRNVTTSTSGNVVEVNNRSSINFTAINGSVVQIIIPGDSALPQDSPPDTGPPLCSDSSVGQPLPQNDPIALHNAVSERGEISIPNPSDIYFAKETTSDSPDIQRLPDVTKDQAGSGGGGRVGHCKAALEHLLVALSGVNVPGLRAAIRSLKEFEGANAENIRKLLHTIDGLLPRDGPSELRLSEELTQRIEWITQTYQEKKSAIQHLDAVSVTGLLEELVREIENIQLKCPSHTESMAWGALETAQRNKITSRLKPVREAGWRQVQGINECLDETCSTALKHIRDWLDGKVTEQIFWLCGMAGTGKSTLAKTVCRRVKERCQLGGTFFCSRSFGRTDAKRIIPTLVEQFCWNIDGFSGELLKLNSLKDTSCSPLEQSELLIIEPLSKLDSTSTIVVVIDALDECEGSEAAQTLLSAVAQIGSNIPGFRAFITSCPEREILNAFDVDPLAQMTTIHRLDLVPRTEVDSDIGKFFRWRLTRMPEKNSSLPPAVEANGSWPPPPLIEQLVSISGGSFIFAHTLCEYAEKAELPYRAAIEDLAWRRPGNHSQTLDRLYGSVITAKLNKLGRLRSHPDKSCQAILTTIVFLRRPLCVTALNVLLGRTYVFHLIDKFRHILYIPEPGSNEVVRVIHPSLQDLLADSRRLSCAGLGQLITDQSAHNRTFVEQLWKLMTDNLCCGSPSIKDPGIGDEAVAYACRFWAEHLKLVSIDPAAAEDADESLNEPSQLKAANERSILAMQDFISRKLLNWIEALGILGRLDICVSALVIAQDWCDSQVSSHQPTDIRRLVSQLSDAHRLVLEFYDCIEKDPSQIYTSALPFIPTTSPLHKTFSRPPNNSINILNPNAQWSPALRTMQTDRDNRSIRQVVISPYGQIIATVVGPYGDKILFAWDATTGHKKWSRPLDVSDQEEMYLFLINNDCVLELPSEKRVLFFDAENGAVTKETTGKFVARIMPNCFPSVTDSDCLSESVAPSHFERRPDRIYWPREDEKTARAVFVLDIFHKECSTSHALSDCGSFLIYGTKNHCVEVWDYKRGSSSTRLKSQVGGCIFCVACSPDARYIAGGAGNVIEIWNRRQGELVSTLRGHDRQVNSIVFSRDGQQLISGSDDGTIKIWYWKFAQGQKEIGHTLRVTSLSFLPNDGDTLMSTSLNGTAFAWSIISNLPSPHTTNALLRMQRDFLPKDQLKTLIGAAGAISRDGELFVMGWMWRPEPSGTKPLAEWGMCMWRLKSHDRPLIPLRMPRRCGFASCDYLALSKDGTLFAWAGISADVPPTCGPPIYSVEINSTHSATLFKRIVIKACHEYNLYSNNVKMAFSDRGTLLISGFGFIHLVHQSGKKQEGAKSSQMAEAKGWRRIRRFVTHRLRDSRIQFETEKYLCDTPHDLFMSGDHFILVTGKGKQEKRERLRWQLLPNGKETLERASVMGHAFFMHRGWIKDAGSDFTCWVPPMYRGRDCYSVNGNRMALGGEDGNIMLIELPST